LGEIFLICFVYFVDEKQDLSTKFTKEEIKKAEESGFPGKI